MLTLFVSAGQNLEQFLSHSHRLPFMADLPLALATVVSNDSNKLGAAKHTSGILASFGSS